MARKQGMNKDRHWSAYVETVMQVELIWLAVSRNGCLLGALQPPGVYLF